MRPILRPGQIFVAQLGNGATGPVVLGFSKIGEPEDSSPKTAYLRRGQVWFFRMVGDTDPDNRLEGKYIVQPLRQIRQFLQVLEPHQNYLNALIRQGAVRIVDITSEFAFVPLAKAFFLLVNSEGEGLIYRSAQYIHATGGGPLTEEQVATLLEESPEIVMSRDPLMMDQVGEYLTPDEVFQYLKHLPLSTHKDKLYTVPAFWDGFMPEKRRSWHIRLTQNMARFFSILREHPRNKAKLLEAVHFVQRAVTPQNARWGEKRRVLTVVYHELGKVYGPGGRHIKPVQLTCRFNGFDLLVELSKEGARALTREAVAPEDFDDPERSDLDDPEDADFTGYPETEGIP